jgi:hypothetical protein
MSRSARSTRGRAWLRVLLLLLALWVPAAHVQAQAAPALCASVGAPEHDVPDSALRPFAGPVLRADVPERPAPPPGPGSARPAPRTCPGAPRAPYAPPLLRTVVLRC